jgi:MoxR-like ATPase
MDDNFIKFNDKVVKISQPYSAPLGELVGREEELRSILAAWIARPDTLPLSPLLLGEAGLGKNRVIYECARICRMELYIFLGHEDVSVEDLVCSVRFSDHPDRKMDYVLSPLATAMIRGGICLIDEIGKIRPRALSLLVSVLDERRYIDSIILGERIYAHPGFRFAAATNLADLEGQQLPDFIRSRVKPVIELGPASREEIDQIIINRHQGLGDQNSESLDAFWNLWQKCYGNKPPTPRDAIQLFAFAFHLAEYGEMKSPETIAHVRSPAISKIKTKHLELAFDTFYRRHERTA